VGILSTITGADNKALVEAVRISQAQVESLIKEAVAASANEEILTERIAELELALEDNLWTRMQGAGDEFQFSRDGLDKIIRNSRLYYLKNPVIRRPVDLQTYYVWGQGISIRAESSVDDVVRAFLSDPTNERSFNSHDARTKLDKQLTVEGNLFLRFFIDSLSGRVRVRTLNVDEMRSVIRNPQDSDEVWFYLRRWTTDEGGKQVQHQRLYPDLIYWRELRSSRSGDVQMASYSVSGDQVAIDWDTPVKHVKTGTIGDMDFGIPETYAALDWARAYKEALEDYKKVIRSLAKWAWSLKTQGNQASVDAAVAKLQSTLGTSFGLDEANPAPTGGSTFVSGAGVDLAAVDVSKAAVDPEGFRRLLLMAASSMGLPETFYGDANVGNLATATSMDRPTELKFLDRQKLWADILTDVFAVVIDSAARAANNPSVRGSGTDDVTQLLRLKDKSGKDVSREVVIDFPPILQRDVQKQVQAIVTAATMNGQPIQVMNDGPTLMRIILTALGIGNGEEIVEKFYPSDGSEPQLQPIETFAVKDVQPGPGDTANPNQRPTARPSPDPAGNKPPVPAGDKAQQRAQEGLAAVVAGLQEAISELRERP